MRAETPCHEGFQPTEACAHLRLGQIGKRNRHWYVSCYHCNYRHPLHPYSRVLEKLKVARFIEIFLAFCETKRFIIALTAQPWTHPKPHFTFCFPLLTTSQRIRLSSKLLVIFYNIIIFCGDGLVPPPNPQAGGQSLVGSTLLLNQYSRSCPPLDYLDAVLFIRNPKKHYALVTREALNVHYHNHHHHQ
jgi:hypothetical protein